jgi:hypothetical protein
MATSSHWSTILGTERKDKKKPFRKVFVFRDEFNQHPTIVTLTNTSQGLVGAAAMMFGKYKKQINYLSGIGMLETVRPATPGAKQGDKDFHLICMLDLDNFLLSFTDSDNFADALALKAQEIVDEWMGDNAGEYIFG